MFPGVLTVAHEGGLFQFYIIVVTIRKSFYFTKLVPDRIGVQIPV